MYLLAKYGVQTTFYFPMVKRGVVDLAATADWTPATGDTKISKDGGNFANTTNNPAATGGTGSVGWALTLTATELQAASVSIQIVDSATKTVEDQFIVIYTYGNASAKIIPDWSDTVRMGLTALPNAAAEAAGGLYTRGTGAGQIAQDANGNVRVNVDTIKTNPVVNGGTITFPTNSTLASTTNITSATGITVITNGDKTGYSLTQAFPANFSVMSISASTGLVDITQAAADKAWGTSTRVLTAGTNIALAKGTGVTGFNDIAATDVWAAATRTITGNGDKTGYSLSQAFPSNFASLSITAGGLVDITQAAADKVWGTTVRTLSSFGTLVADIWAYSSRTLTAFSTALALSVWDVLESAIVTASSIGLKVKTNLDAPVSGATAPTAAAVADAVWDEAISEHLGAGSTGLALNSAGSAGDPWSTAIPGSYGSGTAGKILGDNLNAAISSRASQTSVDTVAGYVDTEIAAILAAVDTEIAAIKTKTDNLPASPAATGDIPSAATIADAVWVVETRTLTSFGTLVADIWSNSTRTLTAFSTSLAVSVWDVLESAIVAASSIGLKLKTNLDVSVSSRLSSAGYTAPDNAGISSILSESQNHPTLEEIEASTALAKEATVTAVKAKTDNLPTDPASDTQVNTRLATSGYTAPDNTGIAAIKAKTDTIQWADITDIKDESLGKWSIDKATNVLTMYKADGVSVLKTFNLTDNASVSERVPV